jgi:hypothetical protein
MALPERAEDPFAMSIGDVGQRIAELNDQRRRIWRNSAPHTGAGETGRRTLAEIEDELEFLYHAKRELLARKEAPSATLTLRRRARAGPVVPAGLFRDDW